MDFFEGESSRLPVSDVVAAITARIVKVVTERKNDEQPRVRFCLQEWPETAYLLVAYFPKHVVGRFEDDTCATLLERCKMTELGRRFPTLVLGIS